jgi:hypothetical protein
MTAEQHRLLIQDLEFELYKADKGMGMPRDYAKVQHLKKLLAEAKAADPNSADVQLAAKLVRSS